MENMQKKSKNERIQKMQKMQKQAGAELCQAQHSLGQLPLARSYPLAGAAAAESFEQL